MDLIWGNLLHTRQTGQAGVVGVHGGASCSLPRGRDIEVRKRSGWFPISLQGHAPVTKDLPLGPTS
jgi:hypothetical protein